MATKYGPTIVTDGLVLCLDAGNSQSYPGSGTTWTDLSVSGINMDMSSTPSFSTNDGGYFHFDGVDDYFYVPSSDVNNGITSPLVSIAGTWSFWVNYDSITNYHGLMMMYDSGGGYTDYLRIISNGGLIKAWMENDDTGIWPSEVSTASSGSTQVVTGSWKNIVLRQNGTNIQFYVNASTSGSAVSDSSWTSEAVSTPFVYIGLSTWSAKWIDAKIAMVSAYNRGLTDTEILQNYNANKGRFGL